MLNFVIGEENFAYYLLSDRIESILGKNIFQPQTDVDFRMGGGTFKKFVVIFFQLELSMLGISYPANEVVSCF